jgi:uncharacterized membrane protein YwzB
MNLDLADMKTLVEVLLFVVILTLFARQSSQIEKLEKKCDSLQTQINFMVE